MKELDKNIYILTSIILNSVVTVIVLEVFRKRDFKILLDGSVYRQFSNKKSRDELLKENIDLASANIELEPEKSLKSDIELIRYLFISLMVLFIFNFILCFYFLSLKKINNMVKFILVSTFGASFYYMYLFLMHISNTNKDFSYSERMNKDVKLILLNWATFF